MRNIESRCQSVGENIVGNNEALRRVLKYMEAVAPTDSTVLSSGETGKGKELIAKAAASDLADEIYTPSAWAPASPLESRRELTNWTDGGLKIRVPLGKSRRSLEQEDVTWLE